jgi:hypothetical protein
VRFRAENRQTARGRPRKPPRDAGRGSQTPELLTLTGLAHVVVTAELLHSKYHRLNPTLRILLGVYRIAVWILVLITLIVVVVHVIT